MGALIDRVKQSLLINGNGVVENFKNNSLYFYNLYTKSIKDFKTISIRDISPGAFYFFHYKDSSNWMQYSPVFVADYRDMGNRIVLFCINFNFVPLEIRALIFDKYITETDFEKDNYLKVDLEGVYNELRRTGFEYALMEFSAERIQLVHKVSLSLLPRFLYHQHPINKYDPKKLVSIWQAKIEKREQRHQEMTMSLLSDFYDINNEISEKYDALKGHIQRIQNNIRKYGG